MSGIETLVETIGASPAAEAVARALVHFLWQGALVGVVTGGLLALLDKGRASTRYAVALGALFLMAALPIATASRLMDRAAGPLRPATPVRAERAVASSPDSVASASMVARAGSESEARTFGVSLLPWIFRLWLAGVAALSLFHLGGWSRVRRLPRQGRPAGEELQALARDLGRRLGIGRAVALLESSTISVPMVVGWLQPVVLVPVSALTGLSPRQLAAILAHELAHVRRHDYLVNLLQTAVETLLFYHPAVWWVSAQVRGERENCCDDLAVVVCGDRLGYARALANLEGLRAPSSPLVLAASGGSLKERIRRLVGAPVHRPRRSWMAGVLALSLLPLAGLEISHASGTPDRREAAAPSGAVAATRAADPSPAPMPAVRPMPAAARTETPVTTDRSSRGTWSAERRGDKIELSLSWSNGRSRSQSSFSIAENQLAGLTAGPEVRFELRRDAGTFRFEGRFDGAGKGAQGTGFFTFEGNPAYTGQMASLGYAMRDDRLREYALFDVSLAFAREIRGLGYGKVAAERLVEFRIHGVNPEFIREMVDAGYRNLSAERLVEFRIHGVSPEFVRAMADAGHRDLSQERLVEFRIHGVSPEFIREMADAGYRSLSAERLVEFRIHGVSPEFIREMADAGYRDLPAERLIEFRIHDVNAEFVRKAASEGYRDLSSEELVELRIMGRLERGRR
ncbi:MAG TPA: M56 family metallopeptidase [Thermoanaerobaculia bacterium]|jgi:beta-lactamase regulating signal transducer with metallopeptidase domain|nr:M56 family metallopeptidase [Thermoanaerobaculia bacterium]